MLRKSIKNNNILSLDLYLQIYPSHNKDTKA